MIGEQELIGPKTYEKEAKHNKHVKVETKPTKFRVSWQRHHAR